MELFKRAYAWGRARKARLGIFGNALGASGALIVLALTFGTPAIAHASIFSSVVDWISDNTLGFVFKVIAYLILSFSDLILYLVGWLFDLVVNYTVFGFGKYFSVSQGLIQAWGVLRDVSNIALIFGFVMIGVATMLDIHGYEVKKTLPRLIIFAVLLNFSLLASEVIIDTSNVFASVLYSQSGAGGTCSGAKTTGAEGGDACGTTSISGKILTMGGVFSIFNTEGGASGTLGSDGAPVADQSGNTTQSSSFASNTQKGMTYLGLAIFVTIAAVVLLAGAIMLIVRAVVLTFLMVLSPIGFAGLAVPPLEKYAAMWWEKILSQSFFAPVYLLLILISLKIGEGIQTGLGGGANLEHALMADAASGGSIVIILIFALMIGFMVASLIVAKQMGAMGADFAISTGRKVVSYPFALANRNGLAPASNYAGRRYNEFVGKLGATDEHGGSRGKRFFASTLRNTGIDEGIAATFGAARKAKVGGFASADERNKQLSARKDDAMHAAEIAELVQALNKGLDAQAEKIAQKLNMHGIEEAIKLMSGEQLEKFGELLSAEKYEKVMDNKDISATAQHSMSHGRFHTFEALKDEDFEKFDPASPTYDKSFVDTLQKKVRDMGTKDAELLARHDSERFTKLVNLSNDKNESLFTDEQNKAIAKADKVSKTAKAQAKQNTRAGRIETWVGTARNAEAVTLFGSLPPEPKMEVRASVIADHDDLLDTFSTQDVNEVLVKGKFNKAQLANLKTRLKLKPAAELAEIDAYFDKDKSLQAGLIGGWP